MWEHPSLSGQKIRKPTFFVKGLVREEVPLCPRRNLRLFMPGAAVTSQSSKDRSSLPIRSSSSARVNRYRRDCWSVPHSQSCLACYTKRTTVSIVNHRQNETQLLLETRNQTRKPGSQGHQRQIPEGRQPFQGDIGIPQQISGDNNGIWDTLRPVWERVQSMSIREQVFVSDAFFTMTCTPARFLSRQHTDEVMVN